MNRLLTLTPLRLLVSSIIITTQLSASEQTTSIAWNPDGTARATVTLRIWGVTTNAQTSSDNSTNTKSTTHRRSINEILAPLIRKVASAIPENVVCSSLDGRIQPRNALILENVIRELFNYRNNAEESRTLNLLQYTFPALYSRAYAAHHNTTQA